MSLSITRRVLTPAITRNAYERMLKAVEELEPTDTNLYLIAKDIWEHSEDQTITNIMFILNREAIHTTYELDGYDTI